MKILKGNKCELEQSKIIELLESENMGDALRGLNDNETISIKIDSITCKISEICYGIYKLVVCGCNVKRIDGFVASIDFEQEYLIQYDWV